VTLPFSYFVAHRHMIEVLCGSLYLLDRSAPFKY
jgi:hypothetical protein